MTLIAERLWPRRGSRGRRPPTRNRSRQAERPARPLTTHAKGGIDVDIQATTTQADSKAQVGAQVGGQGDAYEASRQVSEAA